MLPGVYVCFFVLLVILFTTPQLEFNANQMEHIFGFSWQFQVNGKKYAPLHHQYILWNGVLHLKQKHFFITLYFFLHIAAIINHGNHSLTNKLYMNSITLYNFFCISVAFNRLITDFFSLYKASNTCREHILYRAMKERR